MCGALPPTHLKASWIVRVIARALSFWLILFSSFYLESSRGGGERIWIACDFVFRLVVSFVHSFVRCSLGFRWVVGSLDRWVWPLRAMARVSNLWP